MIGSYKDGLPMQPLPHAFAPKFDEVSALGGSMPNFLAGFTGESSAVPSDRAQASISAVSFGTRWFKH